MITDESTFLSLIEKITNGTASEKEIKSYQHYINSLQEPDDKDSRVNDSVSKDRLKELVWLGVLKKINKQKRFFLWARMYLAVTGILVRLENNFVDKMSGKLHFRPI